jgi:hypothetical protein
MSTHEVGLHSDTVAIAARKLTYRLNFVLQQND